MREKHKSENKIDWMITLGNYYWFVCAVFSYT